MTPVETERIAAAARRIEKVKAYLDSLNAESPYDKFVAERAMLQQALDLLDPEVHLA